MKNIKAVLILVLIAIVNFVALSWFSLSIAAFSTFMGLFLSFAWLFIFSKILEDRNYIDGIEKAISYKDYLSLLAPGIIYYLTVWGAGVSVYIFA